jgi:hypothetical protein
MTDNKVGTTTLDDIKNEVKHAGYDEEADGIRFWTPVVLLAAYRVTGPNTELLARFTGYPENFVREKARRMRRYGLWANGEVKCNYGYQGKFGAQELICHSLVAKGLAIAYQNNDGEWLYGSPHKKSKR